MTDRRKYFSHPDHEALVSSSHLKHITLLIIDKLMDVWIDRLVRGLKDIRVGGLSCEGLDCGRVGLWEGGRKEGSRA